MVDGPYGLQNLLCFIGAHMGVADKDFCCLDYTNAVGACRNQQAGKVWLISKLVITDSGVPLVTGIVMVAAQVTLWGHTPE